ncbi:hypothetical protein HRbin29_01865 [bacterium HR29]|nr:hypothetical protein HRbin29_01865 [bacterium HR29]
MLAGFWRSLPLAAKVPIVTSVVVLALLGSGWAAVAAWAGVQGVATVQLDNVNCGPLEPPPGIVRTVTALVPRVSVPGAPIDSGQRGEYRVPSGTYQVKLTGNRVEGRWRFITVEGELTGKLLSAQLDGRELVDQGEVTLELEKGRTYVLTLRCGA